MSSVRTGDLADVTVPLLRAKFSVPKARGLLVPRPRLFDRLSQGVETSSLTYVTAPKGWGKTSLVASWIGHDLSPGQVAWLSLDSSDDEPERFWTAVVAALRTHGVAVPSVLTDRRRTVVDRTFLDLVANAVQSGPGTVVLVLDRFEVVTDPRIVRDLDHVVRHAWRDLRIVMTSRRGSLDRFPSYLLTQDVTRLDKHALAFTTEETEALLVQHGLSLEPDLVATLQRQAAGRADALRLCATAMESEPEPGRVLGSIPQQRAAGP